MKWLRWVGLGIFALGFMATSARANYTFAGTGGTGTLVGSDETWTFSACDPGDVPSGESTWGSPGVGCATTAYDESMNAYGMIISFTGGGKIDPGSITIGNDSACIGSGGGGTTFCSISPTDIWEAFLVGPDSIEFLAQNPSYDMTQFQDYFVNIFFDGSAPTGFTGEWLTSYTPSPTPEPAGLLLLGTGLLGLVGLMKRQKLLA